MIIKSHEQFQQLIRQLDYTIHNLSDGIDLDKNNNHNNQKYSNNHNNNGSKRQRISLSSLELIDNNVEQQQHKQNEEHPTMIGLERQYNELYSLLKRGLLGTSKTNDTQNKDVNDVNNKDNNREKRNVSALLLGPRGLGKTLVLESCLNQLINESEQQQQQQLLHKPLFRVIRLNGILLKGHDVNVTVREIVRQLSEIASKESYERLHHNTRSTDKNNKNNSTSNATQNNNGNNDIENETNIAQQQIRLYKQLEKESYNLRTRQTTFNNSLSILDEALKTACIDSIPILIIMDELDAFLNISTSIRGTRTHHSMGGGSSGGGANSAMDVSSKRHLLLYHLLDRVAGSGSLISLVSSTSQLSTIGMFEKRVKSRVEGTTKVIYFGRPQSYDVLVSILMQKIHTCSTFIDNKNNDEDDEIISLLDSIKKNIQDILSPTNELLNDDDDMKLNSDERQAKYDNLFIVKNVLERNFTNGQDVRWFSRVMSIALSLYIEDLIQFCTNTQFGKRDQTQDDYSVPLLKVERKYFIESLQIMGGMNINPKIVHVSNNNNNNVSNNDDQLSLMKGNSRINWLLDLSGPQVAVLLSAKRILHRDAQDEIGKPLTFERMLIEYKSYFLAQSKATGPDNYPESIFYRSFCDLLGGFLMPVKDHTGGAPLQYQYGGNYIVGGSGKNSMLRRTALYVNIDLDDELGVALRKNMLDCTSALRDWGLSGLRN